MSKLFPLLRFDPDETPPSWIARMATFHMRGSVEDFLHDLGFGLLEITLGQPEELRRLCTLAGQEAAPVLVNAIRHGKRGVGELRGAHFVDGLLGSDELRFCPACLVEDDRRAMLADQHPEIWRRERLIWRIGCIRVCPGHRIRLITRIRPATGDGIGAFGSAVPETTTQLSALASAAVQEPPGGLQDHAVSWLNGDLDPSGVGAVPLDLAIRQSRLLGTALAFGPQVNFHELSDGETHRAEATGWTFVAGGEAGVQDALDSLAARSPQGDHPLGHRLWLTYGYLMAEAETLPRDTWLRRALDQQIHAEKRRAGEMKAQAAATN